MEQNEILKFLKENISPLTHDFFWDKVQSIGLFERWNFSALCFIFIRRLTTLQKLRVVILWGAINLMEGYGNDNPGANAHVR